MSGLIILIVTLVVLVIAGVIESIIHRRNLATIPYRIHVNGTRGKSSVARLIAAGLREGGITTCCKTTGTLARVIAPDGREYPVFRPQRANIIEQIRIVSAANSFEAKALVIECMALIPYLQWLSEARMVKATHGVITNARPDHLDVMGPGEKDVALALAGMTPKGQKLFTAERRWLDVFRTSCKDRGTELVAVGPEDVSKITDAEMNGFSYVAHRDNVALALKVCMDIGVDRETAIRGMWKGNPDPGAMRAYDLDFFGRRIHFLNGFAANDPMSTEMIWNLAINRYPNVKTRIAIFNCRVDRADRSQQLGKACVEWAPADTYVLMGTGTYIFARAAIHAGLDVTKIVFAEDRLLSDVFEIIISHVDESAMVMGMGNVAGQGLGLVQYFANRSALEKEVSCG